MHVEQQACRVGDVNIVVKWVAREENSWVSYEGGKKTGMCMRV